MSYIGGTNFELSFYDQPDDTSASPMPINTRMQGTSAHTAYSLGSSSASSASSAASSHTESDRTASDTDEGEEEVDEAEEGMVFFGKETEAERAYRQKLSRKLAPAVDSPAVGPRVLRKRDSREFNRRRTMGFMKKERESLGGLGRQRKFSGGFYERDTPQKESVAAEQRTPLLSSTAEIPLTAITTTPNGIKSDDKVVAEDVFLQASDSNSTVVPNHPQTEPRSPIAFPSSSSPPTPTTDHTSPHILTESTSFDAPPSPSAAPLVKVGEEDLEMAVSRDVLPVEEQGDELDMGSGLPEEPETQVVEEQPAMEEGKEEVVVEEVEEVAVVPVEESVQCVAAITPDELRDDLGAEDGGEEPVEEEEEHSVIEESLPNASEELANETDDLGSISHGTDVVEEPVESLETSIELEEDVQPTEAVVIELVADGGDGSAGQEDGVPGDEAAVVKEDVLNTLIEEVPAVVEIQEEELDEAVEVSVYSTESSVEELPASIVPKSDNTTASADDLLSEETAPVFSEDEESDHSTPMRSLDKGKGRAEDALLDEEEPTFGLPDDQLDTTPSSPTMPSESSSGPSSPFASLMTESCIDESDLTTEADSPLPTARAGPVVMPGRYMQGEGYSPSPSTMRVRAAAQQREISLSPLMEMRFGSIMDLVPAVEDCTLRNISTTPSKPSAAGRSLMEEAPPTPFLSQSTMTPRRLGHLGTATPSKTSMTPTRFFAPHPTRSPAFPNTRMLPPAVQPTRKLVKSTSLNAPQESEDLDLTKMTRLPMEQAAVERKKAIANRLDAVFRMAGPVKSASASPAPASKISQFGRPVKPMAPLRKAGAVRPQASAIVRQPMLSGRGGTMMRSKLHETTTVGDSSLTSTVASPPSRQTLPRAKEPVVKKSIFGSTREVPSTTTLEPASVSRPVGSTISAFRTVGQPRPATPQSPLKASNTFGNASARVLGGQQARPSKLPQPSGAFAGSSVALGKASSLPLMKPSTFGSRVFGQTTVMMSRVAPVSVGATRGTFKTFTSSSKAAPQIGMKSPTRKISPMILSDDGPGSIAVPTAAPSGPIQSHASSSTAGRRISPIPTTSDRSERSTTPMDEPISSASQSPQSPSSPESRSAGRTPALRKEKSFLKSAETEAVKSSVSPEAEENDSKASAPQPAAPEDRAPTTRADGAEMEGGETDASGGKRRSARAVPAAKSVPRGRNATATTSAAPRGRSLPSSGAGSSSGAFGVSIQDLAKVTDLNTRRNEVYFCAINRIMERREGPRPPSPTGKVRTIEERDEEDRRLGREARAKRRDRRKSGDEGSDGYTTGEDEPMLPPTKHVRGPGDEEDYETPMRPSKKRKSQIQKPGDSPVGPSGVRRKRSRAGTGASLPGSGKMVKWDKGLVILGADSQQSEAGSGAGPSALKTCLKSKIQLDQFGNVPNAKQPPPDLKRTKIAVSVVLYEGEEPTIPIPNPPAPAASSAKGKGKK